MARTKAREMQYRMDYSVWIVVMLFNGDIGMAW